MDETSVIHRASRRRGGLVLGREGAGAAVREDCANRIYLLTGSLIETRVNIEAFRQGLIELGYTEGNSAGVRKTVVGFGRSLRGSTRVN